MTGVTGIRGRELGQRVKGAATTGAAGGAWGEGTNIAKMAGVSDQNLQRVATAVERVQSAATSKDAYLVYSIAAFYLVEGYVLWGAATNWKG